MKTSHHLLALIATIAFVTPSPLPASLLPVTENGVNWLYNYDPDVQSDATLYDKRPDDSANTALGAVNRYFGGPSGTGSAIIQSNYLRTTTTSGNKVEYNTAWGYTPTSMDGITIEARLRVEEMTGTKYAGGFVLGAGVNSADPSRGYYIPLPFSTTTIGSVGNLDLTQWTTIRFTIRNNGTGTPELRIYINNDPEAVDVINITTLTTEASTYNRIRFGDFYTSTSAEMDGTVDWDYIRWTSEGAFAPIPEPSVALFPIGALLIGAYGYMARRKQ